MSTRVGVRQVNACGIARSLSVVAVSLKKPWALTAQEAAPHCPGGSVVGSIGYSELECNCSFSVADDGTRWYEFRAEPRIGGVRPGGPAAGVLQAGDVITAIAGHLITTREGGQRFANLEPGKPIVLTVRREGTNRAGGQWVEVKQVSVTPEPECAETTFLPPPPKWVADSVRWVSDSIRFVYDRRPMLSDPGPQPPPPPPPPPMAGGSRGYLGLNISCSDCGVVVGEDETPVWVFSSYPTVEQVERHSPAWRAGLLSGDVLTHINGESLRSQTGGRLFGSVSPGDTVGMRYRRNTRPQFVRLVAEEPPAASRAGVSEDVARFTGTIGDAFVQVTGGPITVSRTEDQVIIRSRDITVTVRKSGKPQ
jgi:hypothetical protein